MKKELNDSLHNSVLLIDDDGIDNYINEKIIKRLNFTQKVFVYTDSKSALDFLKDLETLSLDTISSSLPSYIFLDINMPIADGFYFLDEFKKLSQKITSKIKIVMLTSSLNPADEERAQTYNSVVKYLSKPLSAEDLINMN